MSNLPRSLAEMIEKRKADNALRILNQSNRLIDFSSNDYLGFARSSELFHRSHQFLLERSVTQNGATGSRLISGNHLLYDECESAIAEFHQSDSALLFNSGYDANVGFFSSVPQRNDIVLYDELCHASIRDGIKMSNSKSFKFSHNDIEDLQELVIRYRELANNIYVVTESVFSMDGDSPNLDELLQICEQHGCYAVIDEAHAIGVFGDNGEGLIQHLNLQDKVFARIVTFGKGMGCHGAAIIGSQVLREFLINFARSFIYTTGLPPHSVATILCAYQHLKIEKESIEKLQENILIFNREKNRIGLKQLFVRNKSAIQSAIIPGNERVKNIAKSLQENGFDVRAILSPTVPQGHERLRICLHSFNSEKEINDVLEVLATSLGQSSA